MPQQGGSWTARTHRLCTRLARRPHNGQVTERRFGATSRTSWLRVSSRPEMRKAERRGKEGEPLLAVPNIGVGPFASPRADCPAIGMSTEPMRWLTNPGQIDF
jgi:hypothetical protein